MNEQPQIIESRPVTMRMQLVDPEDPRRTTPRHEVQGTFTVFRRENQQPSSAMPRNAEPVSPYPLPSKP